MGVVKNGIFFFLLSKLLAVNCNTPTNSVQFNEQNSGAPNSWIGQPVTSETPNYYNTISAYPPQSTYLNDINNQQPNYDERSLVPQQYNVPHQLSPPQQSTIPQQSIPQGQNIYQPQQVNKFQPPLTKTPQIPQSNSMLQIQANTPQSLPPGSINSNGEFVNQQSINMQYPKLNQNVDTEFQSVTNQKKENQQSQVPQPYNLQSKGGQGTSQSSVTIKPFLSTILPKKNQKQLPTLLNRPIPEEFPDFGESPDFGQVMNNVKTQENKPVQVPLKVVSPLSQQTSFNSKPDIPSNTLLSPKENQLNPSIASNSKKIQIPSQSSSTPSDKVSSIIPPELLPQTEIQLPLLSQSSLEILDKGPPRPSQNIKEVEDGDQFNLKLDLPNSSFLSPTQNQLNLPQSSTSVPPISNQVPSLLSSELLDKGPPTPNTNTMQDTNDGVSLNSISGFPDDKSEPLISNVVQDENILIDNSQTDMQAFLNPEYNDNLNPLDNVSKNQDDSQLELNITPPQLLIDNTQAENNDINNTQEDALKKDISFDDDIVQKLLSALNERPLPENVIDSQFNQEPILEKAKAELPISLSNEQSKENDELISLENLVFDKPLDSELSKYDKSFIVDTENPENMKQDNAKITVFANPNDVHTLLISPTESSTSHNSYPNNYLLDSSPTDTSWYKPSFPNIVDHVQQPDFIANNRLLSPLLNVYQNPLFNNQIPMHPSSNNYYNQQDAYSAVGQNQMPSKIQLPGISRNNNQPSSKDNSGYIYRKVDSPPDTSNSWSFLNKDYTKTSNQNNGYTSYDGKTRTSILGTPSISYQNNNQDILNLSSNDMFVQNMMPVIFNSLHVPLVETRAIFDVTRAHFPRAPLSQVICLTYAIVQSVMSSLQQTLNTIMNSLYGRRSKRDNFNPSDALNNLPGALIDKYSQPSTPTPTAKDMNVPYYTQSYKTDQQPIQQQQQTYYDGVTNMNYYRSQDNNNIIRVVSQPVNTQNYVLNALVEEITTAIRSNLPDSYSIDTPEVKEYTYQVIMTAGILFKNQIDNILQGFPPTMNVS